MAAVRSTKPPVAPPDPGFSPIQPGTRLGPYEVQGLIGQGAMGVVYRAYHAQLERTGAVKVLQRLGPDPDSYARFQREAQAIAHMRHPNILNVYDFGEWNGTPYMIVEFVPGGSLADRILQGPVDQKVAIDFLRGTGDALDYAHSLGIVHRDVKPANVLIGPEDSPILADFGLAKLLESSSIKSITGMTTGTPAYMAPEQVIGAEVGPAADRYSLATIAYELLAGSYPFSGEGLLEMLYAHVHRQPAPPSSVNPLLNAQVDAVIIRGLAKDPNARWPSCEAFVNALEAALKAGPAPAAVNGAIPLAPPVQAPEANGAAPMRTNRRRVPATVAIALGAPAARPRIAEATVAVAQVPAARKRSHRARNAIAALLLIPLLLLVGFCSYGALVGPTLTLSPNTARVGDVVTVTASHVPANQQGVIQLHSIVHTVPFRADGGGNVTVLMSVPGDTTLGLHTVQICWSGSCHAQQTLHVVSQVAWGGPGLTPSPGPSSNPSPSPSSQPTKSPGTGSTPGPSHKPSPSPRPTPRPSPRPTPSPSPRPTPSPSPRPTPTPLPASISVSPNHMPMITGSATVNGVHFGAGKTVRITFTQGVTSQTVTVTAGSDGSFTKVVTVPATALVGSATITACDSSNVCASQTITVTLT